MGADGAVGKGDAKFMLNIECGVWDPSAGIYSDDSKMEGSVGRGGSRARVENFPESPVA